MGECEHCAEAELESPSCVATGKHQRMVCIRCHITSAPSECASTPFWASTLWNSAESDVANHVANTGSRQQASAPRLFFRSCDDRERRDASKGAAAQDSHRFSGVSGVSAPRPSDSTGVLDSRSSSSETRNALDKSAAERLVGDGAEDQSREGMDAIDSEGNGHDGASDAVTTISDDSVVLEGTGESVDGPESVKDVDEERGRRPLSEDESTAVFSFAAMNFAVFVCASLSVRRQQHAIWTRMMATLHARTMTPSRSREPDQKTRASPKRSIHFQGEKIGKAVSMDVAASSSVDSMASACER